MDDDQEPKSRQTPETAEERRLQRRKNGGAKGQGNPEKTPSSPLDSPLLKNIASNIPGSENSLPGVKGLPSAVQKASGESQNNLPAIPKTGVPNISSSAVTPQSGGLPGLSSAPLIGQGVAGEDPLMAKMDASREGIEGGGEGGGGGIPPLLTGGFGGEEDEEETSGGKKPKKKKTGRYMLVSWFIISVLFFALLFAPIAAVTQVILGNPLTKFALNFTCGADHILSDIGITSESQYCKEYDAIKNALGSSNIALLRKELSPTIQADLDCSNATAEQRKNHLCIVGLLQTVESEQASSPIPASAAWLIPIWQQAAAKYKIPWQLLAAVNGARTDFGVYDCQSFNVDAGEGFYRTNPQAFSTYQVIAGHATTTPPENGDNCGSSQQPYVVLKNSKIKAGTGDPYDAVSATFAEANMLKSKGAEATWNYNGAASNGCTATNSDGSVFYPPQATSAVGASLGYNAKLDIPQAIVILATKYRSNVGPYRPQTEAGAQMPLPIVEQMLQAAWNAFGVHGAQNQQDVQLNMQQISLESSYRPGEIQAPIAGDPNNTFATFARGLFQFTPGTFNEWKVDGFNDIFNPLDNILAAVNAQVNSNIGYILDGRSGWGPGPGINPYTTGGQAKNADLSSTASTTPTPYSGANPTDPTSVALAYNGNARNMSHCYVAIVNDWYQAIIQNPSFGAGNGGSIVQIAEQQLALNIHEVPDGSNMGPGIQKFWTGMSGYGEAWCAAFSTWVWRQAGIDIPPSAYSGYPATWGQPKGLFHPIGSGYKPQAGDYILYGTGPTNSDHIGIIDQVYPDGQVITIEGNYANRVARVGPFTPSQAVQSGWEDAPVYGFVSPPASYNPSGGSAGSSGSLNTAAATAYAKSTGANLVSFAIDDSTGQQLGDYNGSSQNIGRSITKSMLLVAYLNKIGDAQLSSVAKAHLTAMIEQSQNPDADWVYNQLADINSTIPHPNSTSDNAVQAVASNAGMSSFHLNTNDPVYVLGESKVTADDMALFFSKIDSLMPASQRSFGMSLLGNISDPGEPGNAGVYDAGVAQGTIYSKSGWESETNGTYTFNQVARITVGGQTYNVAVLTSSASETEGEDIVKNVFQKLFSQIG